MCHQCKVGEYISGTLLQPKSLRPIDSCISMVLSCKTGFESKPSQPAATVAQLVLPKMCCTLQLALSPSSRPPAANERMNIEKSMYLTGENGGFQPVKKLVRAF